MFSEQDEILPEPARSLKPSPTGTSAPLLSNTALTDTLSNFPLFSSRASSSKGPEPIEEDEPQRGTDREREESSRNLETLPTPGRTASEEADQEADLQVVEEETQLQVELLQERRDHTLDQEVE